jgi:protoporphyrinogen oxidase
MNKKTKGRVFILGGGPTGMALADGLSEKGISFTLVERSNHLGGLATTVQWAGHGAHDLGPHKIFTLDQKLFDRVKGLIPSESWITRPKTSSIYMLGKYLAYPPSPFSLIHVYGPVAFTSMVLDYVKTMILSHLKKVSVQTFEQDLQHRVGDKLYEALFKPIALKLWGDPAKLDSKLSQGRVQTPKLRELVSRTLGFKKSSEFEALEFIYPKGGLGKLWDSIYDRTQGNGTYQLNTEVKQVEVSDDLVTSIKLQDLNTKKKRTIKVGPDDFVFSTLPLALANHLMPGTLTAQGEHLLKESVHLNDLMLVFLKVDRESLLDESWVFVPDPEIIFHRVSEQESFDPEMVKGGSVVCCEIMDNELRPLAKESDAKLAELAISGLRQMGFKDFKVLDQKVVRLPKSYPVFRPGFESALEQVLAEFDDVKNFRTVGRQGAFNYIGTLDCMDIGYGAARWLWHGGKGKTQKAAKAEWGKERERTRHYPVLD